ncbi:MAG TPA: radical SAM protein [Acidimicrobiia bacterium]|nr:radical SAM protein [Acidimicrobiia bacterium]
MLSQLHILLTYTCPFECDHCFVYSSPYAEGTFTAPQLHALLDQAQDVPTIDWIYFEGGESLLFYPLLLEGVRSARERGFEVGIVTSGFFGTTEDDAELWLRPLAELRIADLSVSDDAFHHGDQPDNPAKRTMRVAERLGIPTGPISIDPPEVGGPPGQDKGEAVSGGKVMFRGRAVDRLAQGMPDRPWHTMTECPYEELEDPTRIHLDPYGHIQLCQGISIGNVWETPLRKVMEQYRSGDHPICGPLVEGGPQELASAYSFDPQDRYVDECHLCFETRRSMLHRFPNELTPHQVYGVA